MTSRAEVLTGKTVQQPRGELVPTGQELNLIPPTLSPHYRSNNRPFGCEVQLGQH